MDIRVLGKVISTSDSCFFKVNDADGAALGVGFDVAVKVVDALCIWPKSWWVSLPIFRSISMAGQQAVVENQIDEKMVVAKGEALLPGFKQKPLPSASRKCAVWLMMAPSRSDSGIPGLFDRPKNASTSSSLCKSSG